MSEVFGEEYWQEVEREQNKAKPGVSGYGMGEGMTWAWGMWAAMAQGAENGSEQ